MGKNLDKFLATYNPDGSHPVTEITAAEGGSASPFIIVRHGRYTVIVNPLAFDDLLDIDIHSFIDGEDATAGVYGMTEGRQYPLSRTGTTSYGWPSAGLIAVLVGKQA